MRKNAGRGGFVDSKGRTEEDDIPTGHPVMHALTGGGTALLFHKVYLQDGMFRDSEYKHRKRFSDGF